MIPNPKGSRSVTRFSYTKMVIIPDFVILALKGQEVLPDFITLNWSNAYIKMHNGINTGIGRY